MALETLKGISNIDGLDVVDIVKLKEETLKDSSEGRKRQERCKNGEPWYRFFEREIRPHKFCYVRHDVNSLSFTIQNGPIKENGVNGCQVTDILKVCLQIYSGLNAKFPCKENAMTITKLQEAIMWQEERTKDRTVRGVEGTSNA